MYHKQLAASDLDYTGGLHIDIASEEDIDEEYRDIWYAKEQALDKLRRGHFLFLAKDKNTNIFYGWAELLDIRIPWLKVRKLRVPSNVGYISRFYVPPQYRGRLISKRASKVIDRYLLKNTTVNTMFCVTSPDDRVSNGMVVACGYVPYQHLRFFQIMGLKLYIVKSLGGGTTIKKIFIQNTDFWNVLSSILKRDNGISSSCI
jgi:hypothetical protein